MTLQQENRLLAYINRELRLEVAYINYLDKCNDPNDAFNKLLERTYNDQMDQVKIR